MICPGCPSSLAGGVGRWGTFVSQAEKDAYRATKGNMNANVNAASVESDMYTKALIVEEVTPDNVTLVASNGIPKPWAIDWGCTSHFTPNQSDIVSYVPYTKPRVVRMGDAHGIPSLGEGTIRWTCIVNKKCVTRFVHDVQYVLGLTYGLLSCCVLLRWGLKVVLEDDCCKVFHKDGTLIVESIPDPDCLCFLDVMNESNEPSQTDQSAFIAAPSFDLIHKQLAHPGKDTLECMIQKKSVLGLDNVLGDAKNFDCIACIRGKMT